MRHPQRGPVLSEPVERAVRHSLVLAGDTRLEMHTLRQLGGDVPVALGMPVSYCESHLAQGLRLAELLGDQAAAADLLGRLAIIAASRLQFDLALDYGQRAAAAGRAALDDQALAAGLDGLKAAHGCLGHIDALAAVLGELDPLLRRRGDLFLLQHAVFESAYVLLAAGGWDDAMAAMQSAIEINQRSGYPQWTAFYLAYLGWLARIRGRDGEAVALGRRALGLYQANDHPWCGALACAALGTTLLAGGSRAEAIELLERGHGAVLAPLLGAVERVPWVAALAAALVADGEALGRLGELAQARAVLDRGTALARDHGLAQVLREARTAASLVR